MAELPGSNGGAAALRLLLLRAEEAKEKAERVRRATGRSPLQPASARHGQAKPGAWRPRSGHLLTSVGHDRFEPRVSEFIDPD